MNTAQAKRIPLHDLLARLGFTPQRQRGSDWWYSSPFREETEPSFHINTERNIWYDLGRGEGGNVLDFAMAYGNVTGVGEALRWLEREWHGSRPLPLFGEAAPARQPARPASAPLAKAASAAATTESIPITIDQVQPLTHPALLGYLRSRGIPPEVARPYVQELHYTRDGKRYFALAFANGSGGYELRNGSSW